MDRNDPRFQEAYRRFRLEMEPKDTSPACFVYRGASEAVRYALENEAKELQLKSRDTRKRFL